MVDLYVCVSARLRSLFCHPNERLPTFSEEVGFGRRERGKANELYILGGILPLTRNMSMILYYPFRAFSKSENVFARSVLCDEAISGCKSFPYLTGIASAKTASQ